MKMEVTSAVSDESVYLVTFEFSPTHNLHEAYVALNAIAEYNRKFFDEVGSKKGAEQLEKATAYLLNHGIDSFAPAIQRQAREKSREGVLTDSLHVRAATSNLDYLHEALLGYRNETVSAVTSEMRNPMANLTAFTRTLECFTADEMASVIAGELGLELQPEDQRPPLGFGRVLFSDHEA